MLNKPKNLRDLLNVDSPILAPGAYDALSAKVVEQVGFNAVYMTGYGVSASLLGKPDLGLISLKEMADQASNIANSINIPLIADADNGYGNELNMARTIELYERAGVSAIQIEDQESPKKCGHMANKSIISFQEAVQKVRAAVRSKSNKDTVIIARTDANAVEGFDEALRRSLAFVEEGADIIFFEAPESIEEVEKVGKELNGIPLVANMVEGGKTPIMSSDELYDLGYKIIIYPITGLLSGIHAMRNSLYSLKSKGYSSPEQTKLTWPELTEINHTSEYIELSKKLILNSN